MRKVFIAILIFSILFIGCEKSSIGQIVKEGNKDVYLNKKYKFKIEVPTNWNGKYKFEESTQNNISDLKVFEIKFSDKSKSKEDINTKIYVLDKMQLQNKVKAEGKTIKNYLNENNFGEFLDEDKDSIFSIKKVNYNEEEKLKYI